MQVKLSSPLPSLLPYVGFVFVLMPSLFFETRRRRALLRWNTKKPLNLLVTIYAMLVFFHTGWQTLFGFISIVQGVNTIVVYILPVAFFVYFRKAATDQEIHVVLFAMAWAGLAIGLYFAYDSFMIMTHGQISNFQKSAFQYSVDRSGQLEEVANRLRIGGVRSFGLLEKHSISSAWVALGCFAALTFMPQRAILKRMIVISAYALLMLIGLNFVGIVGFVFVVFLMEFGGIAWLRGCLSKRGIKVMGAVVACSILLGVLLFGTIGGKMVEPIQKMLNAQIDLGMGAKLMVDGDRTFFGGFVEDLASFPTNMLQFPPGFIIGDGFSVFGVKGKGSDYGLAETLHRFGLPFFLAIIIGLIRLIRRAERQINLAGTDQTTASRYLLFAVCVTIYLLFAEIHYTVWNAKSILPIFFLSLALYQRCLLPSRSKEPASITPSAPYLP